MRTNIVIDDELIAEAMQLSGARTKRDVCLNQASRDSGRGTAWPCLFPTVAALLADWGSFPQAIPASRASCTIPLPLPRVA